VRAALACDKPAALICRTKGPLFRTGHRELSAPPARYACCGVVSNGCCDVSALRGAGFKLALALLPPKPAIACTSWATRLESPMDAADAWGTHGLTPARLASYLGHHLQRSIGSD